MKDAGISRIGIGFLVLLLNEKPDQEMAPDLQGQSRTETASNFFSLVWE